MRNAICAPKGFIRSRGARTKRSINRRGDLMPIIPHNKRWLRIILWRRRFLFERQHFYDFVFPAVSSLRILISTSRLYHFKMTVVDCVYRPLVITWRQVNRPRRIISNKHYHLRFYIRVIQRSIKFLRWIDVELAIFYLKVSETKANESACNLFLHYHLVCKNIFKFLRFRRRPD